MRHYIVGLGLLITCIGIALLGEGQRRQEPLVRPGQAQVSPEQNKLIARRVFEEIFTGGRFNEANQIFAPNCRIHFGNRTVGWAEALAEGRGWKSASPDSTMTAEQVTTNGDRVTVVWSARGTHTGQGIGVRPTGRRFAMRDRSDFLIQSGKIVEVWNNEYRPELFRQLGVSKPAAFMFFTTERLLAVMAEILPARVYASLLQ